MYRRSRDNTGFSGAVLLARLALVALAIIVPVFIGQQVPSGVADDQHMPPLWPCVAWVISGWLVYFVISKFTRNPVWGLCSAFAWGIGLAVLNALARPWLVFYSWYFVVPPLVALMLLPWLKDVLRPKQGTSSNQETSAQPLAQSPNLRNGWPIALTITIAGLLIMVWHVLAPPEPPTLDATYNVGWGISFYTKLPLPLQIAGFAIVGIAIAWAIFAPLPVESDPQESRLDTRKPDARFWRWFPGC